MTDRTRALALDLARNFRWTWHRPTRELLEELTGGRPTPRLLADVAGASLDGPGVAERVEALHADLQEYLAAPMRDMGTVAYLSPEFGVSETLPVYAGGLGILAGDHLKAASDLRIPLVGVGLAYREGSFRQVVGADGRQRDTYDIVDFAAAGLEPVEGADVVVELGSEKTDVRVWRARVGRVDLYLLEADDTDRLYGGDREHRIRQELILGVGGERALRALGVEPAVYHLNEGHAGFLALADRTTPKLFTTHTPVPAGIDRFSPELVEEYLGDDPEVAELGAMEEDDEGVFNMAAFCLRVADAANGVSRLHGEVSRTMFASVGRDIGHVTNGVHARSWVAPEFEALFDERLGEGWEHGSEEAWARAEHIGDDEARQARAGARRRLVELVERRGWGSSTVDEGVLTIGFARRFAPYKRASLLATDRERLVALVTGERPVQFVFAGKAHPADKAGQQVLKEVLDLVADPAFAGRIAFVEDYDMEVGRAMTAGCDVWLNNPRRLEEASGTSGEKAALNGVLHCSILDGWWDEMYDGANGWAIPSRDDLPFGNRRDRLEAAAVLTVLEDEVVPLFYEGDWMERVRRCWTTLGPRVTASRMLEEYAGLYGGLSA